MTYSHLTNEALHAEYHRANRLELDARATWDTYHAAQQQALEAFLEANTVLICNLNLSDAAREAARETAQCLKADYEAARVESRRVMVLRYAILNELNAILEEIRFRGHSLTFQPDRQYSSARSLDELEAEFITYELGPHEEPTHEMEICTTAEQLHAAVPKASLLQVLSGSFKIRISRPVPGTVSPGTLFRIGSLDGDIQLDLLCRAGGFGLYTQLPGNQPYEVFPPDQFSLRRYNFSNTSGIRAIREYVRRKLAVLTPL